jgi:phosphoesterase RecJ-like protein
VAIDTGIFRYGNTTAEVLRAAAELVELGARPAEVAQSLYESWPERKLRLLARALASLELRDDLAVLTVTQEDLKSTGTTLQDVENFTAFARMLKAAQRVALLVELEGGVVKASLRSRADGDVKTVAEAFGGGGHRSAAGFKMRGSLSEVKRALLERMLRPASP